MKKIKLTQDKYALVDDEDFEWLNQYKWFALKCHNIYYAGRQTSIKSQNKSKNIKRRLKILLMHRIILENKLEDNEEAHHINENGLDNRKCNLRVVTKSQHLMTKGKHKTYNNKPTSSIYKGVCWDKQRKKWIVHITINGKMKHLGRFNNEIDAAKAYDEAAKKYFGEFARLNFNEKKL